MPVLSREALEASPLADLHEIAGEFEIDGYRRLRKADLIDRLIEVQGGEPAGSEDKPSQSRPSGGSARGARRPAPRREEEREERRHERREARERHDSAPESIEGKLTVSGSGSGFVKAEGAPEVYVSAAQIRRLELKDGDRIGGPVRPPRRSERHPSLVRVERINGRNADEVAPAAPERRPRAAKREKPGLPTDRFPLSGSETLIAIDRVAPIGRGSRVTFCGGPHSGKSTALRQLALALAALDGVEVDAVLAGVRPEELDEWADVKPASVDDLGTSPDARAKSVERAIEKARKGASKGGSAVVLIDRLDDLPAASARRSLAAAGVVSGGGSLTVVAVSTEPLGGETTVVRFDQALAAAGKFPSVDVRASSTLRPDLLLDPKSLKALHKAHGDAIKKRR